MLWLQLKTRLLTRTNFNIFCYLLIGISQFWYLEPLGSVKDENVKLLEVKRLLRCILGYTDRIEAILVIYSL